MKKALYFTVVLTVLACATTAFGYGSLVSSFRAPSTFPNGVGWASWSTSGFWVNCNGNNYRYRMTTTGSIYRSFSNPGTWSTGCGAANIGGTGYVFVVDRLTKRVYRIGMGSGSVYSSYTAPGSYPMGVDYCGTGGNYVYYTDFLGRRLYFMHAYTGSIYRSHSLTFEPGDVGYDPRGYLWITQGTGRLVRQCTTTGSVINSFSVSAYGDPAGCGCDGTYVYVGINRPLHSVLKFETGGVGVAPESVGKIKALFR
ncbi:MAG: hypothetical protein V3W11_12975 [bacterium]